MAGDNGIDWKKFGIGLTEAVGGIVGGVVGTIAPGTGAPIAMATGGVVKVIDATVRQEPGQPPNKPAEMMASKPTEQLIAPRSAPAPTEGSDATKAYDYLIKQGWPAEFVKSVMTKPAASSPLPASKTLEEQRSDEIAFWKRLLDDPTLPKELRNHYNDKLNKAEQKS